MTAVSAEQCARPICNKPLDVRSFVCRLRDTATRKEHVYCSMTCANMDRERRRETSHK
jgi:hypothetical protein